MREGYIRQVRRELGRYLPRGRRAEILRDLEEIFASALEHGETEGQVTERLGPPREFAQNALAQLGPAGSAHRRRRLLLSASVALVVAAAALVFLVSAHMGSVPEGAIGYGEAMTAIQVAGAFDARPAVLAVGLVAAVAAVVQLVRLAREEGRAR